MGCSNSTMQTATTPRGLPPQPQPLRREKTGFVVFEVDLKNGQTTEANKDIDKILSRPLPKRLQSLEPIGSAPRLTAEELIQRQEAADLKRQRAIDRKLEFNRRGSIRRSIVKELRDDSDNEQDRIDEKMKVVEETRARRISDIKEKQRLKAERGERIRRNAQRRKEEGMLELESDYNRIEHDDVDDSFSDFESDSKAKQKLKPPKFESHTDSSGYSSRNVSANDEKSTFVTKLNIKDDEYDSGSSNTKVSFGKSTKIEYDDFFDDHKIHKGRTEFSNGFDSSSDTDHRS